MTDEPHLPIVKDEQIINFQVNDGATLIYHVKDKLRLIYQLNDSSWRTRLLELVQLPKEIVEGGSRISIVAIIP